MGKAAWIIPHALVAGVLLCGPQEGLAQTKPGRPIDIPIYQTMMQGHALRYSIWVQVGSRKVEALLDTGSTGLRVLPAVMPGDLAGSSTATNFGGVLDFEGLVVPLPVQIGTEPKTMDVEVIDHQGCVPTAAHCPVHGQDQYLIGGDGMTGHGFSAIIGIGFSKRSHDVPNPLEALGYKHWIVELPLPDDPSSTGHLILDPDITAMAGFKMAPGLKRYDFFGCLEGGKQDKPICGPILLDSGAPRVVAITKEAAVAAIWPEGQPAKFVFRSGQTLSFETGAPGDPSLIQVMPLDETPGSPEFINAGVFPFFFYDVFYDASAQRVGLRERDNPASRQTAAGTIPPPPPPGGEPSRFDARRHE